MKARLRILLPIVMGIISVVLVIWDAYNQRVITSMGMGWDMGAPLWPYQTPEILLYFLNYPAHYVAQPMANHLGMVVPVHYTLVFPSTLLWWWLFGWALDRRLVWPGLERRPIVSVILVGLATLFVWAAIIALDDAFRWWIQFGGELWSSSVLILVLKLAPAVWGFLLSLILVLAAKRASFRKSPIAF